VNPHPKNADDVARRELVPRVLSVLVGRGADFASVDDTLRLYFSCAHPDLTSSSAVALTLRAVGGLTTRQITQAYLVPEATMAQRISRAKRTVSRAGVDRPGDARTVMRVRYLVFNEGYSGDVDLAAEAIQLALMRPAAGAESKIAPPRPRQPTAPASVAVAPPPQQPLPGEAEYRAGHGR
jgi:predicted RNA polymerase sigma factor